MAEELSQEQKDAIDAMSLRDMLSDWRYAPSGAFPNGPYTEYFQKVMYEKKAADPAGWTRASKEV